MRGGVSYKVDVDLLGLGGGTVGRLFGGDGDRLLVEAGCARKAGTFQSVAQEQGVGLCAGGLAGGGVDLGVVRVTLVGGQVIVYCLGELRLCHVSKHVPVEYGRRAITYHCRLRGHQCRSRG